MAALPSPVTVTIEAAGDPVHVGSESRTWYDGKRPVLAGGDFGGRAMGLFRDWWTDVDAEVVIARGDPAELLYISIVVSLDPLGRL